MLRSQLRRTFASVAKVGESAAPAKMDVSQYVSSVETPEALQKFVGKMALFAPPSHPLTHHSGNILFCSFLAGGTWWFFRMFTAPQVRVPSLDW